MDETKEEDELNHILEGTFTDDSNEGDKSYDVLDAAIRTTLQKLCN